MTGAALAAASAPGGRGGVIAGLIVLVLAVLLLMHLIGDLAPAVIFFGGGALEIFAFPESLHHPSALLAPLAAAVAYKMLRGDKRGTTGGRLP